MADEDHITEERQKRLDEISESITRYYDSITEEERAEIAAWGDFATAQLAQIDWPSEEIISLDDELG